MIKTFKDADTEAVFEQKSCRRFKAIERVALRKLLYLNQARQLKDLRLPPANRLEALKGDRQGQHSIRVNDQWRICFVWRTNDAYEVQIADYH